MRRLIAAGLVAAASVVALSGCGSTKTVAAPVAASVVPQVTVTTLSPGDFYIKEQVCQMKGEGWDWLSVMNAIFPPDASGIQNYVNDPNPDVRHRYAQVNTDFYDTCPGGAGSN